MATHRDSLDAEMHSGKAMACQGLAKKQEKCRWALRVSREHPMLADLVVVLHAAVVLFNAGGLLMIVIGGPSGWAWVRHRGFRIAHVALMGFVTVETLLGVTCPLTVLEDWLRGAGAEGSFVQRRVAALIYWSAPAWVFVLLYVAFLLAVIAAWVAWPPTASKDRRLRG